MSAAIVHPEDPAGAPVIGVHVLVTRRNANVD
jgi:hypothetical protein